MRDKHQDIKGSHELLFVLVALLREKKNKFHTRIDRNDFTKARSHQEMVLHHRFSRSSFVFGI